MALLRIAQIDQLGELRVEAIGIRRCASRKETVRMMEH